MEIQKIDVKEQIVKTVVKSGNGGAVWVPKDWLGREVIVILPEKPKLEMKQKVIHLLEPYLKDIISVGIYGSYARNEQTKDSDVDVLVITKDKNLRLSFKEERIDVVSFPIEKFRKAIEMYPIIYYQIVQEAEPLINAYVLEELKNIKISKENFKEYIKDTREHLQSSRELVELDKIDSAYLKSYSVLYSAILRLRGLFIMKCILKNDKFSNMKFKKWVIGLGLNKQELEDSYNVYRQLRDNNSAKNPVIKIDIAEKLLAILEKELKLLEAQIRGK